jgi:hypothetical protein
METQIDKLGKVAITVEPEDWDYNKDYDKLTIVLDRKTYSSYISRKAVPACTYLTDREYWQPFSSLKEEIVMDFNSLKKEVANIKGTAKKKKPSLLKSLSPHTPIMPIEGVVPITKGAPDRNFYFSNMVKITIRIPINIKTITFNLKEYLDFIPDITEIDIMYNAQHTGDVEGIYRSIDKDYNITIGYRELNPYSSNNYASIPIFIKIFKNPTLLLKEYGKIKNINKKYGKNVVRKTLPKPILGVDYNLKLKGISYKIGPDTSTPKGRHVQIQVLTTSNTNKDGVYSVTKWRNVIHKTANKPDVNGMVQIDDSIMRIRCISKKYASDWVYYACLQKNHKLLDKVGTFMKEIHDIDKIKYRTGRKR